MSPFFYVSLTVFGVSVTNLNEPPRALAAIHYSVGYRIELAPSIWDVVNKSNAG